MSVTYSNETHLESGTHLHSLRDPCAPLDSMDNVTVEGHRLKIRGLGDFTGCKKALLPLLQNSTTSGIQLHPPCADSDPNCSLIQAFQRSVLA